MMKVVEFKEVKKSYGSNTVLNNLTFTINEGALTGIIGRNGVGKSTIMKMISGHTTVSAGSVKVFEENPFNSLMVSANSILIDDTISFSVKLTLADILNEAKRFYPNWDAHLAQRLFDYFSFNLKSHHHTLSKGKKSTFNAIIGIAAHCPLTIFDEPINGMDAVVRKDFYRALLKDYIAHPRTILLSSHHLEEIEDLLEDILLIHSGGIHFHGSTTDLQEMFIKVKGKEQSVLPSIANRSVFSKQINGSFCETLVKNDFTLDDRRLMEASGIQFSAVSANDAYIALTANMKGGIDDVFSRTESE